MVVSLFTDMAEFTPYLFIKTLTEMLDDYKNIHHSFELKLKTLTPVSIGSGEVLSPYTDYVYDETQNKALLLKKKIVEERVAEKNLLKDYIEVIYKSFDNNRSNFDLKSFLESNQTLGLDANTYTERAIPCYGLRRNLRREVKAIVKNGNQPFIPGSSIKGAIKTALLYHWFRHEGRKDWDFLMRKTLDMFKQCQREIDEMDQLSRKRHVSFQDKRQIGYLRSQVRRKSRPLVQLYENYFNRLLAEEDDYKPKKFSHFKVGDSTLFSKDSSIFQLTRRLHYTKGIVTIPVNLEAIDHENDGSFRFSVLPKIMEDSLSFLNAPEGIEELFSRINKFSKDNISMELELFDTYPWFKRVRQRDREVFDRYGKFMEDMYNRIDNAFPNEAYFCLGFGKSFFYNSLGMFVYDWDESSEELSDKEMPIFKKYFKLFLMGRSGQKSFPLTRTVTDRGEPMGWVKVEIKT
jgi:CRISPR-associated protein Csm5